MATTKKGTKAAKAAAPVEAAVQPVNVEVERPAEKIVPKEIDLNQYITVYNGFQGKLVYISSRTHEQFLWENFGDEQEIELRELKNARNSCKDFFENNWFMFSDDDRWVIDYLGVGAFYKKAVSLDNFDELFKKSPEEIEDMVTGMSKGQKRSISYRARQLVAEGEIDSRKAIAALEKALGVELIER